MNNFNIFELSQEQKKFIRLAKEGKNILVDACIGSGKTTTIQYLCNELPSNLNILYLTYNKLLKIDARSKIKNLNTTVNNYHGFASSVLYKIGIKTGVADLIQRFNREKPTIQRYDVLIIDEYQDIEQELADMLEYIKSVNPTMQIIAVGDMKQKIYDKTTLDVSAFINRFLGEHIIHEFTYCFRLSENLASKLGRIWKKTIIGVNNNCVVEEMDIDSVIKFLSTQETKDILCLGARIGKLSDTLNRLETDFPKKFNKHTVYASISDNDTGGATEPTENSAIFTTFDSSKGLERKICVVFDFTEDYWRARICKPQQSYEILRNIFCVAASRGKGHIIFIKEDKAILSEETLSTDTSRNLKFRNVDISSMFDFKFRESIEKCYSLLQIERKTLTDISEINIKNKDGLIDISPCIGIYQEAVYFKKYDINKSIDQFFLIRPDLKYLYSEDTKRLSLDKKILFLVSLKTRHVRYRKQVETPFVGKKEKKQIIKRLATIFKRKENVQVPCVINFVDYTNGKGKFCAYGLADVVKNEIVYELKFVSELSHENFLQCACYMFALNLDKGILWNTRKNEMYEIKIPNRKEFLDSVVSAITKGAINNNNEPNEEKEKEEKEKFAVIDTETNWNDEVMSIGVVIANSETLEACELQYFILTPEYLVGGMYSHMLRIQWDVNCEPVECERSKAIEEILSCLTRNKVSKIFAYNASFDYHHLPELNRFSWYDIMRLAAYRQYNPKIKEKDCCSTGRLRTKYGVENIKKLLTGLEGETHNALCDAIDELNCVMKPLGHKIEDYIPYIPNKPTAVNRLKHEIKHQKDDDISCEQNETNIDSKIENEPKIQFKLTGQINNEPYLVLKPQIGDLLQAIRKLNESIDNYITLERIPALNRVSYIKALKCEQNKICASWQVKDMERDTIVNCRKIISISELLKILINFKKDKMPDMNEVEIY